MGKAPNEQIFEMCSSGGMFSTFSLCHFHFLVLKMSWIRHYCHLAATIYLTIILINNKKSKNVSIEKANITHNGALGYFYGFTARVGTDQSAQTHRLIRSHTGSLIVNEGLSLSKILKNNTYLSEIIEAVHVLLYAWPKPYTCSTVE